MKEREEKGREKKEKEGERRKKHKERKGEKTRQKKSKYLIFRKLVLKGKASLLKKVCTFLSVSLL